MHTFVHGRTFTGFLMFSKRICVLLYIIIVIITITSTMAGCGWRITAQLFTWVLPSAYLAESRRGSHSLCSVFGQIDLAGHITLQVKPQTMYSTFQAHLGCDRCFHRTNPPLWPFISLYEKLCLTMPYHHTNGRETLKTGLLHGSRFPLIMQQWSSTHSHDFFKHAVYLNTRITSKNLVEAPFKRLLTF